MTADFAMRFVAVLAFLGASWWLLDTLAGWAIGDSKLTRAPLPKRSRYTPEPWPADLSAMAERRRLNALVETSVDPAPRYTGITEKIQ